MSLEKIEHEKHRMVTYLAKHPESATNPIFIKEALDNFERIICKNTRPQPEPITNMVHPETGATVTVKPIEVLAEGYAEYPALKTSIILVRKSPVGMYEATPVKIISAEVK